MNNNRHIPQAPSITNKSKSKHAKVQSLLGIVAFAFCTAICYGADLGSGYLFYKEQGFHPDSRAVVKEVVSYESFPTIVRAKTKSGQLLQITAGQAPVFLPDPNGAASPDDVARQIKQLAVKYPQHQVLLDKLLAVCNSKQKAPPAAPLASSSATAASGGSSAENKADFYVVLADGTKVQNVKTGDLTGDSIKLVSDEGVQTVSLNSIQLSLSNLPPEAKAAIEKGQVAAEAKRKTETDQIAAEKRKQEEERLAQVTTSIPGTTPNSVPFRLKFAGDSGDGETFIINARDVKASAQFLKLGDRIDGSPYKLLAYEKKAMNKNDMVVDVSELSIQNIETGEKYVLVYDKEVDVTSPITAKVTRQQEKQGQVNELATEVSNPFAPSLPVAQQNQNREPTELNAKIKAEKEKVAKEEEEKAKEATKQMNELWRTTTVNEALNDPPILTIKPRGPAVNGFRLGMPYADFLEKLKTLTGMDMTISPAGTVDISDLIGEADKNGKTRVTVRYLTFSSGVEGYARVAVTGKPLIVIDLFLYSPLLRKLFKMTDMSYDDFCQAFIDNYDIPKLKGKTVNGTSALGYKSPDGWSIEINERMYGGIAVNLWATPDEQSRGFGR